MNKNSQEAVRKTMDAWRMAAKKLTTQEYIDAAEDIECQMEAAREAAEQETEDGDADQG